MAERKSIPPSIRFEVFKRDKFTCQYCGRSAPEVVLHVDHIQPVSKGGDNGITNLVTACKDCNGGKGARELSDDAIIQKRKAQLDELQERREQLEMMAEWQKELMEFESIQVEKVHQFYKELVPGWCWNENGINIAKQLLKKYGFEEVVESLRISVRQYLEFVDDKPTAGSVGKTFEYVERIARSRKLQRLDPLLTDTLHILSIAKKYFGDYTPYFAKPAIKNALAKGWPKDDLISMIYTFKNITAYLDALNELEHYGLCTR